MENEGRTLSHETVDRFIGQLLNQDIAALRRSYEEVPALEQHGFGIITLVRFNRVGLTPTKLLKAIDNGLDPQQFARQVIEGLNVAEFARNL